MSVVSLRAFANAADLPVLLLIDMQQEYLASPRLLAIPHIETALENCRAALAHARRVGLPIAFARRTGNSAFFNRSTPFARWIDGFEPGRHEMIFDHAEPSCYSGEAFATFMNQSPGGFVMAGFAGEAACLSTAVDAFHRHHKMTYLADASASHDLGDLTAQETHRAVSRICEIYGDVSDTAGWIDHLTLRHRASGPGTGT